MSEKKVVSRNVAIALLIISIILAGILVGTIVNDIGIISKKDSEISLLNSRIVEKDNIITSLNSKITEKDNEISLLKSQIAEKEKQIADLKKQIDELNNEISLLNSQIAEKESQITNLKKQIDELNNYIANLTKQINELYDIINLKKSVVWIDYQTVSQPAGQYTYWVFSANYPGYIVIQVHSSTTDKTFVGVMWSSHGINYNERITVGTSGVGAFPVLPTSAVYVIVGNSNWFSGATETVTVIYYY
jgi:peptidoglycan hydrolase CwlO-like protein